MKWEGCIVRGRFKVQELVGSGSYCQAYSAEDLSSPGSRVIIKFFNASNSLPLYTNEMHVLRNCPDGPGLPRLLDVGSFKATNFIVTDHLGTDLMQTIFRRNHVIELSALHFIAVKVIGSLRYLHSCGFLHLDVKPDNILIDDSGTKVSLIDFGFSRRYMLDETTHRPATHNTIVQGNVIFCSSSYLRGHSPSRRCDLESLAYTLIILEKGALPWSRCRTFADSSVVLSSREDLTNSEFYSGVSQQTKNLLTYALGLEYETVPDYDYVAGLFATSTDKVTFHTRNKLGKGKYVPKAIIVRNKSERRMSHTSLNEGKLEKHPTITRALKRSSLRNVFCAAVQRTEDRKDTTPDETGPSISTQLRKRIETMKGRQEEAVAE